MFSFCFNARSITIPADCVFPLYYVTRHTYFLCLVVITPLLYILLMRKIPKELTDTIQETVPLNLVALCAMIARAS